MPTYYIANMPFSSSLSHHGIKGQKWGVRRFQNPDGTLTAAGKERYGTVENFKAQMELKSAIAERRKAQRKALNPFAKNAEERKRDLNSKKAIEEKKRIAADKTTVKWMREKYKDSIERGRKLSKSGFDRDATLQKIYELEDDTENDRGERSLYRQDLENGRDAVSRYFSGLGIQSTSDRIVDREREIEKLYSDVDDYDRYRKYGR